MRKYEPGKVLFWKGIANSESSLKEFPKKHLKITQRLLTGDYGNGRKGLHLEKLHGLNIYSVRKDQNERILYTTIEINRQKYLYYLGGSAHYKDNRFLKDNVLKRFLENNENKLTAIDTETFLENLETQNWERCQKIANLGKNDQNEKITTQPVNLLYNNQFITLNEKQFSAIYKPKINPKAGRLLTGGPGSGKTCLLKALFEKFVSEAPEGFEGRVLYLTRAKELKTHFQEMWHESHSDSTFNIEIKTYDEIWQEEVGQSSELKLVGLKEFITWFKCRPAEERAEYTNLENKKRTKDEIIAELYRELRQVAYYKADYIKDSFNKKDSLYTQKERKTLYALYKSYLKQLNSQKQFDSGLCDFKSDKLNAAYDLIAVDEAHDFSNKQIVEINTWVKNYNIYHCVDSHQSLDDNSINLGKLKLLGLDNKITLPYLYRCSKNVAKIGDQILALKNILQGGVDFKGQRITAGERADDLPDGKVFWRQTTMADEELKALQSDARQHNVAVVTSLEYLKEAEKRFGTTLTFTPEQIKGLEFDVIIAYELFAHPVIKNINETLKSDEFSQKEISKNLPKQSNIVHSYNTYMNKVFTTYTRARENLVIVNDKDEHTNSEIIKYLNLSQYDVAYAAFNVKDAKVNEEQWLNRAKQLYSSELTRRQAINTLKFKLEYTEENIEAILKEWDEQLKQIKLSVEEPSKNIHNDIIVNNPQISNDIVNQPQTNNNIVEVKQSKVATKKKYKKRNKRNNQNKQNNNTQMEMLVNYVSNAFKNNEDICFKFDKDGNLLDHFTGPDLSKIMNKDSDESQGLVKKTEFSLHEAVKLGKVDSVFGAIKRVAKSRLFFKIFTLKDDFGYTAMDLAKNHNEIRSILTILSELETAINDNDVDGVWLFCLLLNNLPMDDFLKKTDIKNSAVLHYAIEKCSTKFIKELLDHGFNPNTQETETNDTALHYAIMHGKSEMVKLILQQEYKFTEINARNQKGETPLILALNKLKNSSNEDKSSAREIVNAILDHEKTNIQLAESTGIKSPPSHIAVEIGDADIIDKILSKGMNSASVVRDRYDFFHHKNLYDQTLLHIVALHQNVKVLESLIIEYVKWLSFYNLSGYKDKHNKSPSDYLIEANISSPFIDVYRKFLKAYCSGNVDAFANLLNIPESKKIIDQIHKDSPIIFIFFRCNTIHNKSLSFVNALVKYGFNINTKTLGMHYLQMLLREEKVESFKALLNIE